VLTPLLAGALAALMAGHGGAFDRVVDRWCFDIGSYPEAF
jgi:hypothetical protein